jgi:LEA14-like dessication related protein
MTSFTRRLVGGVLLLLGGAGAACASLARAAFVPPDVALTEIQLKGIGIAGGSLTLVFQVHNPNGYDLTGGRFEASVDLEETSFGDIALEQPLHIPAHDSALVDVPLRFTWEGVGSGARAFLRSGSARYRFQGRLELATPLGTQTVPVQNTGTVTLRDLM